MILSEKHMLLHVHVKKLLSSKFVTITIQAAELFKSFCFGCQKKRKRSLTNDVGVKLNIRNSYSSRGQAELIGMQTWSQGNFKGIIMYQDHQIFCSLSLYLRGGTRSGFSAFQYFSPTQYLCCVAEYKRTEFAEVIQELKLLWSPHSLMHEKQDIHKAMGLPKGILSKCSQRGRQTIIPETGLWEFLLSSS